MLKLFAFLSLILLNNPLLAGSYGVGFKSFAVEDVWHKNRILPDFQPQPAHRRIWVSLWYPTPVKNGPMKHADYFETTGAFDQAYMSAYQRFRHAILYQEVHELNSNRPIPQNPWPSQPEAFQRPTEATRDAPFAEGSFPVIIYQTGSQGGFEENAPLFEALARLGYCVLTVIAPATNGNIDHTYRSSDQKLADTILVSENLRRDPHLDLSQVVLMGYSAGAQTSLQIALHGFEARALILLDTTMENFERHGITATLLDELKDAPASFTTPILAFACVIYDGKSDRFRIYNHTPHAPKVLVDFGPDGDHNDFMWHGIVEREMRQPIDEPALRLAKQRYAFIQKTVVSYLEQVLKPKPDWKALLPVFQEAGSFLTYTSLPKDVSSPPPDLDTIFGLRFIGDAPQALEVCRSVPPDQLPDPLLCAVTALETLNLDQAEIFLKTYRQANPGKPKGLFASIRNRDAAELEKLIKAARNTKKSR